MLFLDAGQQIIRAALLPSEHPKPHEAWRVLLQRSREQSRQMEGETETEPRERHRERERCQLRVDGAIGLSSLIAHRTLP